MAVVDLLELGRALTAGCSMAGVDHGEKMIGVAISDVSLTIASPVALIEKTKFTRDAEVLFGLMAERLAAGVVIGLPVNMDGSEGRRCQSARGICRSPSGTSGGRPWLSTGF
jgi:putative Holliday junction resolvase